MEEPHITPDLRERYHATLGYVHATLEQQTTLLEQHRLDEAQWKTEREALHQQLRELGEAFSELKQRAISEHHTSAREVDEAKVELKRQAERLALEQEKAREALHAARMQTDAAKAHSSSTFASLEADLGAARRERSAAMHEAESSAATNARPKEKDN